MNSVLEQQVDALARLASTIRTGLTQAELAVPPINELLAELAEMGVCDFEYEGPAVYCRPAGRSSDYDDSFIIYSAALAMPGGIGRHCGTHASTANEQSTFTASLPTCGHVSLPSTSAPGRSRHSS